VVAVSDIVAGKAPLHFVVHTVCSGLVVLFLSPIRWWFIHQSYSWLLNPFLLTAPPEILAGFFIILLFSFCLGIPFYLATPLVNSDEGLNALIMEIVFGKARAHGGPSKREAGYFKWLVEYNLYPVVDFEYVKEAILSGLLVSSELVLLSDALWLIQAVVFGDLVQDMVSAFLTSCFIFGLTWAYNKYYSREQRKATLEYVGSLYDKWCSDRKEP
jgi:hypothetical protein